MEWSLKLFTRSYWTCTHIQHTPVQYTFLFGFLIVLINSLKSIINLYIFTQECSNLNKFFNCKAEEEESRSMWRHKNEGLFISHLGVFFLTPPLLIPYFYDVRFFWGDFLHLRKSLFFEYQLITIILYRYTFRAKALLNTIIHSSNVYFF